MISKEVLISNKTGLHARPAGVFTKTAAGFKSDILVEYKGKKINAKSILNVLAAGIGQGSVIRITAEGEDEAEAAAALVRLIGMNFGE